MLSRRDKEKSNKNIFLGIGVLVVFFVFIGTGIISGSSFRKVGTAVSRPFLIFGNGVGNTFSGISFLFQSKKSLLAENTRLQIENSRVISLLTDRNVLADENVKLKESLNRKGSADVVLATILAKPNRSLYDTLILDIGKKDGIKIGDYVFAGGVLPFGEIVEVSDYISKARLFSTPGVETQAVISGSDTYVTLVGRGGGNFEVSVPREVPVEKGTLLTIPNLTPYVLAEAVEVISDPRDPEKKVLLRTPVILNELKFVQVFRSAGFRLEQ